MAYSGRFTPKNPQKYVGDPKNIIYRSSWEVKVMDWLDRNDDVISWQSEETIVPYKSPVDGKWHRYFPDFLVKVKTKDGKFKTMMLEVKPKKQTLPPEPRKRITKQYINEVIIEHKHPIYEKFYAKDELYRRNDIFGQVDKNLYLQRKRINFDIKL